MRIDQRVARCYEDRDEDERLWQPGLGELTRLRTWDIFSRVMPPSGRVLDVGGGPGTHAAHLASRGYDVLSLDPLQHHVEVAARRATDQQGAPFGVAAAEARSLPVGKETIDVVLLMGPLYHLREAERYAALREAKRCLRSGGLLVAEAITRHAWLLDATRNDVLATEGIWDQFHRNITSGISHDPEANPAGGFWAYFHGPDDLRDELVAAGFAGVEVTAVEGYGWLLGDLPRRMTDPGDLLRAIRLTEREPSMLGTSAHIIATGIKGSP